MGEWGGGPMLGAANRMGGAAMPELSLSRATSAGRFAGARLRLRARAAAKVLISLIFPAVLVAASPGRASPLDHVGQASETTLLAAAGPDATPHWVRIWQDQAVDIVILLLALGVLTAIFFFQNWVVRRPKQLDRIRIGFLVFTAAYLGFYAHAQLSVVNVLTFTNALLGDFKWERFLTEPMIFILWCSVAGSLPFWGRGPYCGWLCPFGALQELANRLAKVFKVPQLRLPWGLHERLWPLKYAIFMGILGLSLYSLPLAEKASEIEPFKTAIILHFVREWWYVLFAVALLAVGLFVERFFCRYLCPLGAALALPGRLRMFEWLRRYSECGSPCQTCSERCMVQAIHPTGQINPNECLYCLHCQEIYYDDHLCPVMIERRQRRERRQARASKPEAIASAIASNAGGAAKGCGPARP